MEGLEIGEVIGLEPEEYEEVSRLADYDATDDVRWKRLYDIALLNYITKDPWVMGFISAGYALGRLYEREVGKKTVEFIVREEQGES